MFTKTTDAGFWGYMGQHQDQMAIVFTSQNVKSIFSTDRLIRTVESIRYDLPPHDMYSHCGLVWWEDGRPMLYDQTWPHYKRRQWGIRYKNLIYIEKDPEAISYAKETAKRFYAEKRGYALGQLITMSITELTKGLIPAPIETGMVCSEALARELIYFKNEDEDFFNSIDPYGLSVIMKKYNLDTYYIENPKY